MQNLDRELAILVGDVHLELLRGNEGAFHLDAAVVRNAARHFQREVCRRKHGARLRRANAAAATHIAVQLQNLEIDERHARCRLDPILDDEGAAQYDAVRIAYVRLAWQHHLRRIERQEHHQPATWRGRSLGQAMAIGLHQACQETAVVGRGAHVWQLASQRHRRWSHRVGGATTWPFGVGDKEGGRAQERIIDQIGLRAVQISHERARVALLLSRVYDVELRWGRPSSRPRAHRTTAAPEQPLDAVRCTRARASEFDSLAAEANLEVAARIVLVLHCKAVHGRQQERPSRIRQAHRRPRELDCGADAQFGGCAARAGDRGRAPSRTRVAVGRRCSRRGGRRRVLSS